MFLKENKSIYLGLHRVASKSIQRNLLEYTDEENQDHQNIVNYEQAESKYGKPALNKNFVFSFVRNPWDRMVSIFFNIAQTNPQLLYAHNARTFEDFVNETTQNRVGALHDFCHSQSSQLKNKFGEMKMVDYIGRYESLVRDYNTVCKTISIEHIKKIPKLSKSNHFYYDNYYNEDLKNKVGKFFEDDVDEFKYSF